RPAGDGGREGSESGPVRQDEAAEPGKPRQELEMNANLVTIRDLHVALGGNEILHGLDADVGRNKVTALIGLNGCGKSTLLRALMFTRFAFRHRGRPPAGAPR